MASTMPSLRARRGGNRLAVGAHLQRERGAAQARQPLRAAGAGNDAEQHFGLADLGAGDGDAVVAGHRELETAAERVAVNRRDERLADVLDVRQARVHGPRPLERLLARLQLLEDVDVGAGDERRAGADQDDRVGGGIVARALDGVADAFRNARAERVDGRVVDGDDGDAIANFVTNQL